MSWDSKNKQMSANFFRNELTLKKGPLKLLEVIWRTKNKKGLQKMFEVSCNNHEKHEPWHLLFSTLGTGNDH